MNGRIINVLNLGGKAILQIETDADSAKNVCESVQDALCDIVIKKYKDKGKRSINANNYLWTLCTEIADELSKESPVCYVEVYRDAIHHAGVYEVTRIPMPVYDDIERAWASQGIGWQVIKIGDDYYSEVVDCLICKGSSV